MTSPPPSPASREIARQLLDREQANGEGAGPALQRLCTRVTDNLRGSVGDDGYNALLARALTRVERDHPALKDVRRVTDSNIQLDGVVASIDRHGLPAVTVALESLVAALVDLLSSLIGADMVLNLIDSPPQLPDKGKAP